MTPTEAADLLLQAVSQVRSSAQRLRSPDAVASAASIVDALTAASSATKAIEETEQIAESLAESLQPRAARVDELSAKIEGLRKLSDDVNTTPAEAGTAHRTANKLQAECDTHAKVLVAASEAIDGFAEARDEFWEAYSVFSERYERVKAAKLMRDTRSRVASTPIPDAPDTDARVDPRAAPETKPNWVAVIAIAVPVAFIFAPALIPLAYFGPKWFRKAKTPDPPPRPVTPAPAPRPRPAREPRPTPAPASAAGTTNQVEPHRGSSGAVIGMGVSAALVMLLIVFALRKPEQSARTYAAPTPVQALSVPEPVPIAAPAIAPPKKKSGSAVCDKAKAGLGPGYRLNDDCSALTISVKVIHFADRASGRLLRTFPRSACSAATAITTPEPVAPRPGSFEAFEQEQQARRDAARRARELPGGE
jgi:hypothetical protein